MKVKVHPLLYKIYKYKYAICVSIIFVYLIEVLLDENCQNVFSITGGSHLMQISLVQITLLQFFKTFQKYLDYEFLGLFISLLQFLYLANVILGLFISLLQF